MSRGRCFLVLQHYLRAVLSHRYLSVSDIVIPARYTVAAAAGPKQEDRDVDLDLLLSAGDQ